jgi:hypothetical protein
MDIPTEYKPSVFHRELQKNYGILPHSPTDFRRHNRRNHRRIVACMSDTCPSACILTVLPTSITDVLTDGSRMSDTCPSAPLPTKFLTSHTDGITDGSRMSDTCPSAPLLTEFSTEVPTDRKFWRDFQTFLVRISINFWRNYRRNLIPPTAINFRR